MIRSDDLNAILSFCQFENDFLVSFLEGGLDLLIGERNLHDSKKHFVRTYIDIYHVTILIREVFEPRTGITIFTARCYASAVLAMALCPSVCPSVRHKSVFY